MAKGTSENRFGWSRNTSAGLSVTELRERTEQKAKEIWERKGCVQGKDLEIWLEAERLVKGGRA